MGAHGPEWIREFGHKLDRQLRHELLTLYRPAGVVPCVTARLQAWWRERRPLPVLIYFEPAATPRAARGGEQLPALEKSGCRNCRILPSAGAVAAEAPPRALRALLEEGKARRIVYDREVQTLLDVTAPTVGATIAWPSEATGAGVTVAVLDTGVYPHPDLKGRIAGFKDFIQKRRRPYDDNGHGTHVAGIIAASGATSRQVFRGIAPGARIVGVKVLDRQGSGRLSAIISGLEWAAGGEGRQLGVKVINLSLGAEALEPCADDPLCQAVEWAWAQGIVVCVAAGNTGPLPRTIGSPGTSPSAVTVGAEDHRRTPDPADDAVASFSSRGPTLEGIDKPDLVAPGAGIISLRSPGSFLDKSDRAARVDAWHTRLSGTSMACPVVAGAAALLLQAHPDLSPDAVKKRLLQSARSLGAPRAAQGAGLLRADTALGLPPAARQHPSQHALAGVARAATTAG